MKVMLCSEYKVQIRRSVRILGKEERLGPEKLKSWMPIRKLCTVERNNFGSTVRTLLHVTLMLNTILWCEPGTTTAQIRIFYSVNSLHDVGVYCMLYGVYTCIQRTVHNVQ
jgi:hypothetical protein